MKPRFGTPGRSRSVIRQRILLERNITFASPPLSVTVYYFVLSSNNAECTPDVFFYSEATAFSKTFSVSEHLGGFLHPENKNKIKRDSAPFEHNTILKNSQCTLNIITPVYRLTRTKRDKVQHGFL